MTFRVVIPARYASVRLPGKPLKPIAGQLMIERVYQRARASGAAEVLVATEDERIASACRAFGARAVLTASTHESGTDRIAEVAVTERWPDEAIVINLQGDEPLMPVSLVSQVARLLADRPDADMATLATPMEDLAEFLDPKVVKIALSANGTALYFSRAPIPWPRDGAVAGLQTQTRFEGAWRHIGLYAYRVRALKRIAALPPSTLELTERLEQLRALENGIAIVVGKAGAVPGPPVDTDEDLARVEALVKQGAPF